MQERNTVQKTIVLDAVKSLACHPTADQVYDYVNKHHPTISRATVYRNLNRLAESGQIAKCNITHGADRFDHTTKDHCHMMCEACGQVFDIEMDKERMNGFIGEIAQNSGLHITGHDILFKGICPECKNKI